MAQTVKRDKGLLVRLSLEEKAKIERKAKSAGLKTSEFVRRELGIGEFDRAAFQRVVVEKPELGYTQPEDQAGENFEQRVKTASLRMPRRAAETAVRREEAAERAKAALGA